MRYILNHISIEPSETVIEDSLGPNVMSSTQILTGSGLHSSMVSAAASRERYCVARPMAHKNPNDSTSKEINQDIGSVEQYQGAKDDINDTHYRVTSMIARKADHKKILGSAKDETVREPTRQVVVQHIRHADVPQKRISMPTYNLISSTNFKTTNVTRMKSSPAPDYQQQDSQISTLARRGSAAPMLASGDAGGDETMLAAEDAHLIGVNALTHERKYFSNANHSEGKTNTASSSTLNQDSCEDDNGYTYTVTSVVRHLQAITDDVRIFEVKNVVDERKRWPKQEYNDAFDVIKVGPPSRTSFINAQRSFVSVTSPIETSRQIRPKKDINLTFNKATAVRIEGSGPGVGSIPADYTNHVIEDKGTRKHLIEAPVENPLMQSGAHHPPFSESMSVEGDINTEFCIRETSVVPTGSSAHFTDNCVIHSHIERVSTSSKVEGACPIIKGQASRIYSTKINPQEGDDLRCFVLTFAETESHTPN